MPTALIDKKLVRVGRVGLFFATTFNWINLVTGPTSKMAKNCENLISISNGTTNSN